MQWNKGTTPEGTVYWKASLPNPVRIATFDGAHYATAAVRRYDPEVRCWVTFLIDVNGDQVGFREYKGYDVRVGGPGALPARWSNRLADATVWGLVNGQTDIRPKVMVVNA